MCFLIFARPTVEPTWKKVTTVVLMIGGGIAGQMWENQSEKENARFRNRSFLYELREGEYTNNPRYVQHLKYYSW